jgi:hypothetical protein
VDNVNNSNDLVKTEKTDISEKTDNNESASPVPPHPARNGQPATPEPFISGTADQQPTGVNPDASSEKANPPPAKPKGFDIEGWLKEFPPPEPVARAPKQPRASQKERKRQGDAVQQWATKALEDEVARVVAAKEGDRNDQLNKSAFALGQIVAAGALDMSLVVTKLTEAAQQTGLDANEIKSTIASGLRTGKAEPRDLSHVGPAFGSQSSAGSERIDIDAIRGTDREIRANFDRLERATRAVVDPGVSF